MTEQVKPLHLRLPATSANLGPGFDALGLAMGLYLTIDASVSGEFAIEATGRDASLCGRVERNLILGTYIDVLEKNGRPVRPLQLGIQNEIPIGMGCGSSAAALLAGVVLANHFGGLGWEPGQVVEEACRREGHPDNVAACWYGGMTASSMGEGGLLTATCGQQIKWGLMVALPPVSLSTAKARAMLPATYSRADAVANVQNAALLVAAFALDRPDLLAKAMEDRIHQPYRAEACPLLPKLLPLAGNAGVLGVALSGAGPSVLIIVEDGASNEDLRKFIRETAGSPNLEILETSVASGTYIE